MNVRVLAAFAVVFQLTAQQPRFKAIWEPVNYKADLMLFDVHFATEDAGWVVGGSTEMAGGLILHTTDAGRTWDVQYGDAQSSDRAVQALRFIDGKTGWATQDSPLSARLLHTVDGQNWDQVGEINSHYVDLSFTSPTHGVYTDGTEIYTTADAGHKWQPVAKCAVQTEIEGLTKNVECQFHALSFPSAQTGYAAAGSIYLKDRFFIFKTTDGGATWVPSTISADGGAEASAFTSDKTGFVRTGYPDSGRLYRTTDGGGSWTGIGASPGLSIRFVDQEVGWSFHYSKLSFTTNGTRWTSRTFKFPVSVTTFSLPSRRRAYVVGQHGMIYRYSVVPIDYTAKGMIDAPMMPASDTK
jgi:photosystem II stability/assembly factor-like uncharacterized protein